jgi:nicotinamide-nucleotide amidase
MRYRDDLLSDIQYTMIECGVELVVAESMTAGLLASTIASKSGCGKYFRGGLTAYTLEDKVRFLQVNRDLASQCQCVSAEVAQQMAKGALSFFEGFHGTAGVKWSLATTGYAEPDPDRGIRQEAYVALARSTETAGSLVLGFEHITLKGDVMTRDEFRNHVVDQALFLLHQQLHLRST